MKQDRRSHGLLAASAVPAARRKAAVLVIVAASPTPRCATSATKAAARCESLVSGSNSTSRLDHPRHRRPGRRPERRLPPRARHPARHRRAGAGDAVLGPPLDRQPGQPKTLRRTPRRPRLRAELRQLEPLRSRSATSASPAPTTSSRATPHGPIRSAFGTAPNTTVRAEQRGAVLPAGRPGWLRRRADGRCGEGGTAANGAQQGAAAAASAGPGRAFGVSAARTTTENNLTTRRQVHRHAPSAASSLGQPALSARRGASSSSRTPSRPTVLSGSPCRSARASSRPRWHQVDLSGRVGGTDIDANERQPVRPGLCLQPVQAHARCTRTWPRIDNDGAPPTRCPAARPAWPAARRLRPASKPASATPSDPIAETHDDKTSKAWIGRSETRARHHRRRRR